MGDSLAYSPHRMRGACDIGVRFSGFSLVELMAVVTMIGLLAGIAMPMYSEYVMRSKLTEAYNTLSTLRVQAEQYFQDNRTYVGWGCAPDANTTRYFTYSCGSTLTASAYTITATGVSAQGTSGFVFTLDQNNAKTSTGPSGWTANNTCWIRSRSGTC